MNNNFTNHVDDKEIKMTLHKFKKNNESNHLDIKINTSLIFFYCNQMNYNQKQKFIILYKELFSKDIIY